MAEEQKSVEEPKTPYDPRKHLMRVQGNREYLPVAQRIVWFRESHPDWGIETNAEVLDLEKNVAIFRATVKDENGRIRAQATKVEDARGFADFVEKAETGSIGRALALIGFGTQWCDLDDSNIVDAPQPRGGGGGGRPSQAPGAPRPGTAPKSEKPNCKCAGPVHDDNNIHCPESPNYKAPEASKPAAKPAEARLPKPG